MAPHLTFLVASTGRTFLDHGRYSALQSCNFISQWFSFFKLSYICRMLLLCQFNFYMKATFKNSSPWLLFFPPLPILCPSKTNLRSDHLFSLWSGATNSCLKASEQAANWDEDWEQAAAEKMGQEILGHCGYHTLHILGLWQEGHKHKSSASALHSTLGQLQVTFSLPGMVFTFIHHFLSCFFSVFTLFETWMKLLFSWRSVESILY